MIETFFTRSFTVQGRLPRLQYFLYYMAWAVLLGLLLLVRLQTTGFSGVLFIIYPAWAVVRTCLQVQRLHDVNLSGWYVLITFVPLIGGLFELFILFAPGTDGLNKYGADPLEGDLSEGEVLT